MPEKITSYNGESVGSGSVVNEVLFEYNDFAQLIDDYQAHSGAVNPSTTLKVQYGYADCTENTIRPTTITYPNGRVITLDYGTTGGNDAAASRPAAIVGDDANSTHLADYSYLGEQTFVEVGRNKGRNGDAAQFLKGRNGDGGGMATQGRNEGRNGDAAQFLKKSRVPFSSPTSTTTRSA